MSGTTQQSIKQLNSFLRGEISALETYSQALRKLDDDPEIAAELHVCRASHQERVDKLKREVIRLGGEPTKGSGVWGGLAKLFEGGAKAFGGRAAVAALEQGEDHGHADYLRGTEFVSPDVQDFIRRELIPEQRRTHDALARLKERVG